MHPGQQISSSTPWSDEEIQICINLREDMEKVFLCTKKTDMAALWEELSRRLACLGHERSPEEIEAKFCQYKPRRQRKKRKRALQANQQELAEDISAPQLDQQEQLHVQSARSQGVEMERTKLLEKIDLNAFFSEENSWRAAIPLQAGGQKGDHCLTMASNTAERDWFQPKRPRQE